MNTKYLKFALVVVLITLSCLIGYGLGLKKSKTETKKIESTNPIKIGFIAPLTGDAAVWGEAVKKGVELAYGEIEEKDIAGKKIKLIYEDSQCDPKTGVSAAQKLINFDKTKIIIGTVCSSVTLAIAPITETNKVIVISAGASSPEITKVGDYIFRIWPSDIFEGQKIAEFASQTLNLKSVGIIYLNNEYGVGLKNAFIEAFQKNNGKVKIVENFDLNAKDFKTQLTKIKNQNVEALYFAANPQETPIILKQIKELDIKEVILANGPAIEGVNILQIAGNSSEGVFYAQVDQKVSPTFKQKYQAKFSQEAGTFADLGYDVLNLVVMALEKCQDDNSVCLRDNLYQTKNYQGASGLISFDKNGDLNSANFVIKTIKNGQAVEYGK